MNNWLNILGLLWAEYDADKPLAQIVREACAAHKRRLGFPPDLVLVHPSIESTEIEYKGIRVEVKPHRSTLKCHYHAVRIGTERAMGSLPHAGNPPQSKEEVK